MTPNRMFSDIVHPSVTVGNRRRYAVPLSIAGHTLVIVTLVAVPLLMGAAVPSVPGRITRVDILLPPAPPPPAPTAHRVAPPIAEQPLTAAPIEAPATIAPERNAVVASEPGFVEGPPVAIAGTFAAPPVPPPPPAVQQARDPIPVGGTIRPPAKVKNVAPLYPVVAQAAHVEGLVILEATIGADGRVENVRVLRSNPLLDGAAMDAVRQWEYTPTLLNGVPVPVLMTVTVNFNLH